MAPERWISLYGLAAFAAVVIYLWTTHSLRQRRHPSAAIAWLLSLVFLPYLALPAYFLFGNRKVLKPARPGAVPAAPDAAVEGGAHAAHQSLARALGLPPACAYERFVLHQDGAQAYRALLDLLARATTSIDLSTYLLGRDAVGAALADSLIRQARAGVRVRLLIDGIGRFLGGFPNLRALRKAGIQVRIFVPPFSSAQPGHTNLRNHRKLAIVDGHALWTGGRNLAREYFDHLPAAGRTTAPWIDLSFELYGDIARAAQRQFQQDWDFGSPGELTAPATPAPPPGPAACPPVVQLVPSGPDQPEDTIYGLLISGCFAARHRILAVSPYFVPDSTLTMALSMAAKRGVRVDLLLPQRSNHRLADLARGIALRELAAAGVRTWLAPRMIHAKAIVFDEAFALAGSANLDERSLFINFEIAVAFYEASDVATFARWIEAHRQQAVPFEPRPPSLARELLEGGVRWLAFQL